MIGTREAVPGGLSEDNNCIDGILARFFIFAIRHAAIFRILLIFMLSL